MKFIVGILVLLWASPAVAFHEVDSFARKAYGDGAYFTGSPRFKGYDCSICHTKGPGSIAIDLEVSPEHLKANLNTASAGELRDALAEAGFDSEQARMLSARIIDWRDPDHQRQPLGMEDADYIAANKGYGARDGRFKDLSELLLIADLERDDFTNLTRYVTLYGSVANRVYSITATSSQDDNGSLYMTTAIVRVTRQPSTPYQVLKWHHHNG